MAMGSFCLRTVALLLLSAGVVCASGLPTKACVDPRSYAYGPEEPFDEYHLEDADIVFRGRPIGYRGTDPETPADFHISTEITFEVLETYLGVKEEAWTVLWFRTVYDPDTLEGFRNVAGDDLVVALELPGDGAGRVTQLPRIRLGILCEQPSMSRFFLMEPVLRARGLVD
jgi:hypothetical protein